MKNIRRLILIWSIVLLAAACKKDKDEEKTTITGYYQGYTQGTTGNGLLNIAILHRNNNTCRMYSFVSGVADTAYVSANALEGVWALDGNNYHCTFLKNNNTVNFQATVKAPGNTIEGSFQQSGSTTVGGTFVLNKK